MPQMTRTKFGSDQVNRAEVEKRYRLTDWQTDTQTFILIG